MMRKLFKIFEILSMCMIAFLPSSNSLPLQHNYCKTDSDCNQPNFYCYESRECVECTNCSFYNRQVNTNTKCAKNKDQCGTCVSGMEAEYNFDGTFTCQPIFNQITTNNNSDQNPATNNEENKNLGLYISIPLSILIFITCLAIVIKYKMWVNFKRMLPLNYQDCSGVNNNNNNNNNIVLPTNPPPPYSKKGPSAPPEEDPLIQQTRILHDDNQRANPFHNPNYVNGGTYSDNPPINQEIPSAVAEDENTQPSGWAPTSDNSSDLSNQPISFQNILSTTNPSQQEHFEQPSSQNSNSESSNNRNPQFNIQINLSNTNMNNMQVINET